MPELRRMRCASKRHPTLYEVPEGTLVAIPSNHIVLRTGRVVGGRWCNDPVLCAAGTPCWDDHPVYGPQGPAPMRLFIVRGRHSDRVACGPRCTGATGPDCECACSGANHGRGGI